jgi:hypothetical protein
VRACVQLIKYEGERVKLYDVDTRAEYSFARPELHPCDPTHLKNLDDIAFMNNMHVGPLLHLLRNRYCADQIYTFTGDILISVNPYKAIEGLYSIPTDGFDFKANRRPHVYAVADAAYRCARAACVCGCVGVYVCVWQPSACLAIARIRAAAAVAAAAASQQRAPVCVMPSCGIASCVFSGVFVCVCVCVWGMCVDCVCVCDMRRVGAE